MMPEIPFAKPHFAKPLGKMKEEIKAILDGGKLTDGEYVAKFEEELCRIHGADFAITTSSGTLALIIAVGSSGVSKHKDKRYTPVAQMPSFTWKSTAIAATLNFSDISFRDIDYEDWCVHSYGIHHGPSYAIAVDTFGTQFNPVSQVPIIYDRAHSVGQKFKAMGLASIISFSPSKMITTLEGGVILTNKPNWANAYREAARTIGRMPEVNAYIGLTNLGHLPEMLEWKRRRYNYFKRMFSQFDFQGGSSNHAVIGMLVESEKQRNCIIRELAGEIELRAYYKPLHQSGVGDFPLPVTDDVASRIICLPSWYGCPARKIVECIREVIE